MRKLFTCLLYLVFGTLLINSVQGQEKIIIKGTVISATDGLTLPGASVAEIDKNNRIVRGTFTDIDGNFALQVSSIKTKIQISFMGFKMQELEINGLNPIKVKLIEDIKTIDAVEIVAEKRTNTGFIEIDDRNLSVPIEKISAKDIEEVQASSIDEALQGRLSGVDIVSNSGNPGGGMSIRIRGVSTLSANSTPLIVIDNVPFETQISPDFNFATANEEGYAQMLNISVDDIKEISVLKDAAATALWGTKAANGVLSITTKRGTRGQKPIVSYTYRGTYIFEPKPLPLLSGDQYSTLIYEAHMNVHGIPLDVNKNPEFQYDPSNPYWYYNYSQNTNWLDEISRSGYVHNHDISLTGGGTKAFYRFSSNYQDEQGITLGTDLKRLTSRLNLDYSISDKLKLKADFSYAHGLSNANYDKNIRARAYEKMPNMSVYEYDEYGNKTPVFFSPEDNIQGHFAQDVDGNSSSSSTYNPVAMATYGKYKTASNRVISKFNLSYIIFEGFRYSLDVSLDVSNTKRNWFLPQIATGRPWTEQVVNMSRDRDEDSYNIYSNNQLSYHKVFNKIHDLTASLNFQTNSNRGVSYDVKTAGSASSELSDPSIPARIREDGLSIASSTWQDRTDGLLAMFNYVLLDRYIIAAGVRREGSSKFDQKYRHGYYPSLSAAWRISGESFMKNFTFLNDFRLRLSYGQNGHAPKDSYTYFDRYTSYNWTYLGSSGVYPANMQLTNLKWENFITKNLGFNLEMFDSRLMMIFDVYKNQTKDMFGTSNLGSTSGFDNVTKNIGSLDNQGWDFSFRSYPIKKQDFSISFDFNIAQNYNVLRKVDENLALERGSATANGSFIQKLNINDPIGSFYGYRYKGVYKDDEDLTAVDAHGNKILDANGTPVKMVFSYPDINYAFQPGDAKYEDINHDGNINSLDVVYLGDANPDFTGGFGSTLTYKGFSFNIYFYGRAGNQIVNDTKMQGEKMFDYDNQTTAVLRRWRKPGDNTDVPRALMGYGYNWLGSDRYVENGDFLRMKYITVTYNVPSKFVNKLKLRTLRLSATMNNLLTFTKYTGQDPEITIKNQDASFYTVGYDYSNAPVTKEITLNINISF